MKTKLFSVLILFSFCFLYAQDKPDLLKSVQAKYNSINTLSVNFTKTSGSRVDLSGIIFIKKKNMLRIELKNNTIVTDGQTFWNYNLKENKVIINNYDESKPTEFSLDKIILYYPSKCTVNTGEDGNLGTLTFVPKTSVLNFKSAELFINNDNLVEKIIVDDPTGKATINLSGYKLNQDIPDSEFTFSPPKGSKIIDLR
jgi:outer membrane lipoprotein carrier protein